MTGGARTKTEVLEQANEEWRKLISIAEQLSDEEKLLPGAVGRWSVKEMLGHVAHWDTELVNVVDRFRRSGEETDYGDDVEVDSLNQAEVDKQSSLSFKQLGDLLRESHDRLMQFLQGLPEEAFSQDTYTGDWIATDSGGHYREHREDVERWRDSRPRN